MRRVQNKYKAGREDWLVYGAMCKYMMLTGKMSIKEIKKAFGDNSKTYGKRWDEKQECYVSYYYTSKQICDWIQREVDYIADVIIPYAKELLEKEREALGITEEEAKYIFDDKYLLKEQHKWLDKTLGHQLLIVYPNYVTCDTILPKNQKKMRAVLRAGAMWSMCHYKCSDFITETRVLFGKSKSIYNRLEKLYSKYIMDISFRMEDMLSQQEYDNMVIDNNAVTKIWFPCVGVNEQAEDTIEFSSVIFNSFTVK